MIAQHSAVSERLDVSDLDWGLARSAGLTPREIENVRFFADIEGQVPFYFLELIKHEVAHDAELYAFLTMWNYEEYFHAEALTRLMKECGISSADVTTRRTELRGRAHLRATVEDLVQTVMANVIPRQFIALWMTWGAMQECLTTKGYEEMVATTSNPVFAELARRIAKQERRHFAFYYNQAHDRLAKDRVAQRFVRAIIGRFFSPVGSGVKSNAEVARLVTLLFPRERIFEIATHIDGRMNQLPGLDGLPILGRWASHVQPLLPAELRASPEMAGKSPRTARA